MIKTNVTSMIRFAVCVCFLFPYVGIVEFGMIQELQQFAFLTVIRRALIVVNLILGIGVICILLYKRRKCSFSYGFIFCMVPYVYLLFRTVPEAKYEVLKNLGVFLVALPLMEWLILKNKAWFLSMISALNSYALLNFYFILRYSGGGGLVTYNSETGVYSWGHYLLGYDNSFLVLFLPLLIYNVVLFHYQKKKRYLMMAVVLIVSEFMVFSATSVVAIVVWCTLIVLRKRKVIAAIFFKPLNWFLIYLTVEYLLIGKKLYMMFSAVLMRWFGKSIESVRISLWQEGLKVAEDYFWFGKGYRLTQHGRQWGASYPSPHNMILEWIGHGGIIFTVLAMGAIFYALWKLNRHMEWYESSIMYSGIIAFMVAYFTEGYGTYTTYWMILGLFLASANIKRFHTMLTEGR